jgi:aminoglycoside 6'-N-acetyltransferase
MTYFTGSSVQLRPAGPDDVEALARIRARPEVWRRWRGENIEAEIADDLASDELHLLVIENQAGTTIGGIQWEEEADPDYRHASIDIFLDPAVHGRGYGTDAVHTLVQHLIRDRGHHRLTIDPAADNEPAIRCYAKVGFRPVGTLREYERGSDGTWHDGLLMELVASDLADQMRHECVSPPAATPPKGEPSTWQRISGSPIDAEPEDIGRHLE